MPGTWERGLLEIPGIELNPDKIQINMVFFKLNRPDFDPNLLVSKFFEKGIKINGEEGGLFRFVTNNDVNKQDIDFVIDTMKEILL